MASEARRVHSQHAQLALLVDDFRQALASRPNGQAMAAFEHFADALGAHMRVEETVYFPALHGLLPDVDSELTDLIQEHRLLGRALDGIRAHLEADDPAAAATDLEVFAERSAAHEETEERLIERVRTAAETH